MKTEKARQIRDWVAFNKLSISKENDEFDLDEYSRISEGYQAFVASRVPDPSGRLPFDSKEYVWATNSVIESIREIQRKYLVSYFKKHNKKFYFLSMVSKLLMYAAILIPILLVTYLNVATPLSLLNKFAYYAACFAILYFGGLKLARQVEVRLFNAKEKEQDNYEFQMRWANAKNAFIGLRYHQKWADARYDADFYVIFGPHGRDVTGRDSETYQWKNVGDSKFIIANKATGKEALLLPGIKPHSI